MSTRNIEAERVLFAETGEFLIERRDELATDPADQLLAIHAICLNLLCTSMLTMVDYAALTHGRDRDDTFELLLAGTRHDLGTTLQKMMELDQEEGDHNSYEVTKEILRRLQQ